MNSEVHGFKLLKTEEIPEIAYGGAKSGEATANAYEFAHESGAKLLYLENDDPEKAFTIGFKTLPKDSTGVFHILEHSVLCGSKKFPVKEPFTNLLKSSMQTFLNAMTFPDKTIYPVASTNEKDFYNLINVYMDAVLFPNIYKNKNIFYQEGGHKTLDGFSGVVFNEMSGVYSDPQEHIFEGLMQQLFPGSCYSYSSGGAPEVIKTLTYEEYLAQHNTNYSLQNSYIIVYGKLDIEKMLAYLNDEYLSKTEELKEWRSSVSTTDQGKWENDYKNTNKQTPKIIEVQTAKENAECGAGFVIKRDHRNLAATRVLLNSIASSNESPLKKALLDENFCADVDVDIVAELYEPFIIVECKGSKENASQNLNTLIASKVKEITEKGISKELLEASISNIEFKLKEKLPDCTNGLDYSICVLSEWLYDDAASTSALKYIDDLKWLKDQVKTNYFDNLANEIFVENKHIALVEIKPVDKKKLEKPNYSEEEKVEITKLCDNLASWQETPDSKEDEAKIPVMDKADIGEINEYPKWEIKDEAYPIIHYDIETNGISHINRYYSINNLSSEELQYASLISMLLGKLATSEHTSEEIDLTIRKYFGHLNFTCAFFENINDVYDLDLKFAVRSSCLDENADYQFWFIDELLQKTKFNDSKKIKTILTQKKVMMEQAFIAAGHQAAINRALSKILPIYSISDFTSGIEYYKFIKNLLSDFDRQFDNLKEKLVSVRKKMFNHRETLTYAGTDNVMSKVQFDTMDDLEANKRTKVELKQNTNIEAYKIPSDVNYCALVNDMRLRDKPMSGAKIAASKIISLEYLWNEVRVKNGAYGAGMLCNIRGTMQFYSYRDPQSIKTLDSFSKSAKWLRQLDIDQRTLDNFIISTVAKIDAPTVASGIILYQDSCYFSNIKHENREKVRDEIINTSKEDILEAAKTFEGLFDTSNKCVFGGKNIEVLKSEDFKIIDLFSV